MSAGLTIEIGLGTSIEDACEDACRIARILGCAIEFEFNGVRCVARPISPNSRELAAKWREELERPLEIPGRPKICSSGNWH